MGMLEDLMRSPQVDRFAKQQANFDDDKTDDFSKWNELVGAAPQKEVEDAYTRAAREVDQDEYSNHVTPGVGGTNPLGDIRGGLLGGLAGRLLGGLGGNAAAVPGLRTTNPSEMSEEDVARLADYMRKNHPDKFGKVAAEVQKEEPGVLQKLMGNKMLMLAAAGLAAKLLNDSNRRR